MTATADSVSSGFRSIVETIVKPLLDARTKSLEEHIRLFRNQDREYQAKINSAIHGRLAALDCRNVTDQTSTGFVEPEVACERRWGAQVAQAAMYARSLHGGPRKAKVHLTGPDGYAYIVEVTA